MPIHESGEDYLETIYLLHKNTGYVRSIDVAVELGYSKPSISRAMGILKKEGYITITSNGEILLTDSGLIKARSVYERHTLLARFLEEILHVSHENAEKDACRIEHVISTETFEKLNAFVNSKLN